MSCIQSESHDVMWFSVPSHRKLGLNPFPPECVFRPLMAGRFLLVLLAAHAVAQNFLNEARARGATY